MYLYIGCNGRVSAIDPSSGDEVWRTPLSTGVFSSTSHQDVCILEHQGQVTDMRSAPIPQACLSIYTESEHKLITSTTSDEDGNYKFDVSMLNSSPRTRASE